MLFASVPGHVGLATVTTVLAGLTPKGGPRMTRATRLPRVRIERLVVEDVLDEIVAYDLDRDKAHSLNSTAALVWTQCAHQTTRAEAVALLSRKLGSGKGETALDYGLAQLQQAQLLRDPLPRVDGMSRRAVMRRIGLAAAAGLPLVTSLLAPPAIQAQSAGAGGCGGVCGPGPANPCPGGCDCVPDDPFDPESPGPVCRSAAVRNEPSQDRGGHASLMAAGAGEARSMVSTGRGVDVTTMGERTLPRLRWTNT